MDRRTRNMFVIALVALVAVTGAVAFALSSSGASDLSGSAVAPSVVGVIVAVESQGLDDVRGFSLRTGSGETIRFTIGGLENGAQFPPGHLVEHQATAQAIRVWYQTDGEIRVAIRLEDAT